MTGHRPWVLGGRENGMSPRHPKGGREDARVAAAGCELLGESIASASRLTLWSAPSCIAGRIAQVPILFRRRPLTGIRRRTSLRRAMRSSLAHPGRGRVDGVAIVCAPRRITPRMATNLVLTVGRFLPAATFRPRYRRAYCSGTRALEHDLHDGRPTYEAAPRTAGQAEDVVSAEE